MKKTFKRSLACLLAVLMIAFSMPFTASAASQWIGPTEQGAHDYLGESGGIWWDPQSPPTSEPDYVGYNSDALSDWWGDGEGGWGIAAGGAIDLTDEDSGAAYDDLFDEYKPFVSVYVTDYSTNDAVLYGTAAKNPLSACKVMNPSDLKAGDKIAVTFEVGGFDALFASDFKFTYDTDYVKAGYWKSNRGKWSWTDSTASGGGAANGVVDYMSNLLCYSGISTSFTNIDVETGEVATTVQSNAIGTGDSAYVGKDVRTYGENGIVYLTISLEVKQDCNLADVIKFKTGEGGVIIAPYDPQTLRKVRPELTNPNNTNRNIYAYLSDDELLNGTIYGLIAPPYYYNSTSEVPEPGHTHEYGEPTYQWAEDNSTCTATVTCSTCDDATEGHTVTESGSVERTAYTAPSCDKEGSATYTATFTNELFLTQEKTVTLDATGHDFTGEYAHIEGGNTHAKTCSVCGAIDTAHPEDCDFEREVTKEPTCASKGEATLTCKVCHYSYTTEIPVTEEHTPNYAAVDYQWTGDDETGYTACVAVVPCSVCGKEALRVNATVTPVSDGASCTTPGKTTYTATFADENLKTQTKVVEGAKLPHDYDYENAQYEWNEDYTSCKAVATCKNCDATVDATSTNISSEVTIQPTCQVMGTTTYTATFEGDFGVATTTAQNVPTVEHSYTVLVSEKQEATVDAPGKEAVYKCEWCDATIGGEPIEQLAHYTVTATAENGEAKVEGVSPLNNVEVNGDITLVATPASEDLEFVGWSLNGKIVSTDLTYKTKAIADAAYVAIFKEAETTEFTVVFTDTYGNVYSSQTVTDASKIDIPDVPSFVGFTFKGWSMTDEEIKALKTSATITAKFERTAVDQYTVTVPEGCTIEGVEGTTTTVDYNTKVTVNAPAGVVNGTWKVDNAAVAYGKTYSFFVGADITLTFEEDASVTAEPAVAAVSVDREEGTYQVAFLATRSLEGDYDYIYAGFVFGKNMNDDDLDLNNVGEKGSNDDSGIVKVVYCSTDSEQFRLNYGIAAMEGKASAKAFLAYVDNAGETHIKYAKVQEYQY